MAVGVQPHGGCKKYFSVTGVPVKKIAIVCAGVARFSMSDRFRRLMNGVVVKGSDHDCDRSHY